MSAKNLSPQIVLYIGLNLRGCDCQSALYHCQLGKDALGHFNRPCRFSLLHHLQNE